MTKVILFYPVGNCVQEKETLLEWSFGSIWIQGAAVGRMFWCYSSPLGGKACSYTGVIVLP